MVAASVDKVDKVEGKNVLYQVCKSSVRLLRIGIEGNSTWMIYVSKLIADDLTVV